MPNLQITAAATGLPVKPAFTPPNLAVELADEPETRSVAQMVDAWFAAEASFKDEARLRNFTDTELEAVFEAHFALEECIVRTPSRTQKDFVAKLRFALATSVHEAGYKGHERVLLAELAYECAHMCDRDNEAERDRAEAAGSYEAYLSLIGMPMPERTTA